MITLELAGVRYTNFLSISVERSIENITGTFNFVATFSDQLTFPIKRGSPCRVFVNNTAVLTGYVEKIDIAYSDNQHTVSCQGRDGSCDIFDSQVDGDIEFKPPVTLETVIRETAKRINIPNVTILNEAGNIPPFEQKDLVSSRIGQTAFNFMETYARKRQVFITTDGQGKIMLARGSSQHILLGGLYNQVGDPGLRNNIKSCTVSFDDTNRFNVYRCKSQGNPVVLNFTGESPSPQIVNRVADSNDPAIRPTRVLVFNAENSSDGDDVQKRAVWETNVRRARAMTVKVTVYGDSYDGVNPWRVNRLVQVIDDFANINATLLIKSISFNLSVDSGTTTTLELVTPDGFTPEPTLSKDKEKANVLGKDFKI